MTFPFVKECRFRDERGNTDENISGFGPGK